MIMKKILSLFAAAAAAVLLSQAGAGAQNYAISVQNDTVWHGFKNLSYDGIGALIQEQAPENVFVYIDYTTSFLVCQDIQSAISMSSEAGVVFMNPLKYSDWGKGRRYGPFMAVHEKFMEWSLFEDAKKNGTVLEIDSSCKDPLKELGKKEYTAVLLKLDKKATVGYVYDFISKVEEVCPNIVIKVPEGDYSMADYIHIFQTDPSEYDFETYPCVMGQAWTVYRGSELWDPQDFAKNLVAFESITRIKAPGARPGKGRAVVEMTVTPLGTLQDVKIVRPSALPGLDSVIVNAVSGARAFWVPQYKKDAPINVKVTLPVEGEIGAY